jgi:hypothetical protein
VRKDEGGRDGGRKGAGAPAETRGADEAAARGEGRGPAKRQAAPPPQGAAGPPRHAQRPARSRADAEEEGGGRAEGEGGGAGQPHPILSVCIDVRPTRLVERAVAPSEPMPFELREREGERAQGLEERRVPGEGRGV